MSDLPVCRAAKDASGGKPQEKPTYVIEAQDGEKNVPPIEVVRSPENQVLRLGDLDLKGCMI